MQVAVSKAPGAGWHERSGQWGESRVTFLLLPALSLYAESSLHRFLKLQDDDDTRIDNKQAS